MQSNPPNSQVFRQSNTSNFENYIDVNIRHAPQVDSDEIYRKFQAFLTSLLAEIPNSPGPADPYGFNSHMGACTRFIDEAASEFVKAKTCFYTNR